MTTASTKMSLWGNSLELRLTETQALLAGLTDGTPVQVTVTPGRIVIETITEPSLAQMLSAFDPARHAGEAMSGDPMGEEVIR